MDALLSVRELDKAFGGLRVVDQVSFDVPPGSICALIGPNGAGKSTLFNLVTNLYRSDRGRISFCGEDVSHCPPHEIAQKGLIRTFQTARVFPHLSVEDNVMIGAQRQLRTHLFQQALWFGRAEHEEQTLRDHARRVLEAVGLAQWTNTVAESLPLGAQKLLELARGLMSSPRLLLLDEPAAGLNDSETATLGRLLTCIRDAGVTLMVVDHNMSLVMNVADEVLVLDRGRVIAHGTPDEIQRNPQVIQAYLGQRAKGEPC